jgi:hypothetical protein
MDPATAPWSGLLHPIQIAVGDDGRVYVADDGDKTVKVFDASGRPVGTLGRKGSGPGEFEAIQDIAVVNRAVYVFDPKLDRILRFPDEGGQATAISDVSGDFISALGQDRLVMANDPRWSMPAIGREAWPLLLVTDLTGTLLARVGERQPTKNPFVDRIANFVLPAGTRSGDWIWLAYLNDPTVRLQKSDGTASREIRRPMPFDWKRIPDDFRPTLAMMAPAAKRPALPFDVLSLGIDTDTTGRAFVLTALGPHDAKRVPALLGVDVLTLTDTLLVRYRVPGLATHIAVSPAGDRIYLLDEPSAVLTVYERHE